MVRVKAPLTRQQGTSQSSCGHPGCGEMPRRCAPWWAEWQEQHGSHSGHRRLKWSSTHLYHRRSFMMLSLKGNICLPTKNYNSKNGIWYNYNLWIKKIQKRKQTSVLEKDRKLLSCNRESCLVPPYVFSNVISSFSHLLPHLTLGNVYSTATSVVKGVCTIICWGKTRKS